MASEIVSELSAEGSVGIQNPAPEDSRSKHGTPETSMMLRRPVMVMCDLPEASMEQLQQIFMAQTNSRVLQRTQEDTSQDTSGDNSGELLNRIMVPPTMLPPEIHPRVVKDFQECLWRSYTTGLVKLVKQHPASLFLHTRCASKFSRSALHVAVFESSHPLLRALSEKLDEEEKSRTSWNFDSELISDTMTDFESEVEDFLLTVDDLGLSAVDMVALTGNDKLFRMYFNHRFTWPPSKDHGACSSAFPRSPLSHDAKKKLLETASPLLDKPAPGPASRDAGTTAGQTTHLKLRDWLDELRVDFVYCLHAATARGRLQERAEKFVRHVIDNGDSSFLEPLFDVRDKYGRSPLHVCYDKAGDEGNRDPGVSWLGIWMDCFPNLDWNMPDYCGRTPLHWAAAQGHVDLVTLLVRQEKIKVNLNATYGSVFERKWKTSKRIPSFSNDPVENLTPLHLAVVHNHLEVVTILLNVPEARGLDVNAVCKRKFQFVEETTTSRAKYSMGEWTAFQLAAYMGHERILQVFLKDPRLYDPGLKNRKARPSEGHNMIPALCLATSKFHPMAVKALVDCRKMDISVKDAKGNTALHYAATHALGRSYFYINLYDYISVLHFTSKPPASRKPSDHDIITCIDMLMQSGLDMVQKDGVIPTLHPSCPEKVQRWWLQKMAKEAQENKNNLITAANAVSVTAALVATASFVGPLQPPLGLLNDEAQTWLDGYSQVKHTSVEVFLFCDSFSFYLAIAAIVFAMLPSWPLPHEGLAQEVRIARRCVQVAVLLLFGSIIFVVCAFSAASIAVVPDQQWRYKTLVVISTSLGILVCFFILLLSFMRLLTLISSKNELAKKVSNVATRIMLWERDTSVSA